ncbi:nuclear prelamin A recognition factor [Tachyglossus aculeatus]|uniref:nuclear prelamin A recognition factor n=1 Tax=Tachyglossus aculeatus TaxID=9261 RepID=UPI0018F41E30|nr:nuclear prelamin A recognition factor [Tachyglossus aculeatus]
MKCENCTKKECSKKAPHDAAAEAPAANREDEGKSEFHKLADAKIFLSDCLACDSCVTEEEGARVFQQNQKEFFRVLNLNKKCDTSKHKVLAASICPQSLPYFAAQFNLCVTDASRRLCGFLKSLGVHYVFDTTIAADFSILESQKEFVQRYQRREQEEHALPMLTSACPGWVRYAERVLASPVTLHICTAKSPQQIMGSLVKDYFARQKNLSPDKIFHIIVAPCYDKKLEALREDFYTSLYDSQDVDCVLTSGEIVQILEQSGLSLNELEEVSVDTLFGATTEGEVVRHDGTRSDGYLEHVFKHAAKELFDMDVQEITYRTLKNKDFQEVTLERDGEVLLRFAAACGFRNIQNLVLKMKRGRFPYHFVEVLACPRGCLNGKGQMAAGSGKPDRALLRRLEEMYAGIPVRLPEANAHVQRLYQDWLQGTDSPKVQAALHTSFGAAEPPAPGPHIKW